MTTYLMSIRPEYSSRIFAGTKTFELRRRPVKITRGDVVLVYETSPTCAVVGAFAVKGVRASSPRQIWRELFASLGVSRAAYDAYFEGAPGAWAIEVDRVRRVQPIGLDQVRNKLDGFVPPQSYLRLAPERLALLPAAVTRMTTALAA